MAFPYFFSPQRSNLSFSSNFLPKYRASKVVKMAASLAIGLRTTFVVLGCLAAATVIYTVATDGFPFRKELLTPWMAATLIDFYINILAIGVWIIYKESNWILSVIWIVLLVCFGSITACAYIVLQFVKLTPQESLLDPIYFVLLRNKKREEVESKSILSVVSARFLFCILGCLMLATLTYTIATDGSPFRLELLTPWMSAMLVDFYVNVFAISVRMSTEFLQLQFYFLLTYQPANEMCVNIMDFCLLFEVWVAYKEATCIRALIWIILLICFGSITTCVYIALQLFNISPQDPIYLILFSIDSSKRL